MCVPSSVEISFLIAGSWDAIDGMCLWYKIELYSKRIYPLVFFAA